MPISSVIVSIARNAGGDDNLLVELFKLIPHSSSTLVDSPGGAGVFRRTKFKVILLDGNPNASSLTVPTNAKVNAKIFYQGSENTSTILELESIGLPTMPADVKSKKEWRQLGSLENNLVIQLGFKLSDLEEDIGAGSSPQWTLSQAFVSQPETG